MIYPIRLIRATGRLAQPFDKAPRRKPAVSQSEVPLGINPLTFWLSVSLSLYIYIYVYLFFFSLSLYIHRLYIISILYILTYIYIYGYMMKVITFKNVCTEIWRSWTTQHGVFSLAGRGPDSLGLCCPLANGCVWKKDTRYTPRGFPKNPLGLFLLVITQRVSIENIEINGLIIILSTQKLTRL